MAVRLFFDENLSERLVDAVASRFPGSLHVRGVGLAGASDSEVWTRAAREGCVLASKDEDFAHLATLRGPPPKVIWLNVRNAGTAAIAELLLRRADDIEAFVADTVTSVLAVSRK